MAGKNASLRIGNFGTLCRFLQWPGLFVTGRLLHSGYRSWPRLLCNISSQTLLPTGRDLLKNHGQRFGDSPGRIVLLHFSKVAVIANVVADSILIDVPPLHLFAGDVFSLQESLENGTGVGFAAAEIVDFGDARSLPELI